MRVPGERVAYNLRGQELRTIDPSEIDESKHYRCEIAVGCNQSFRRVKGAGSRVGGGWKQGEQTGTTDRGQPTYRVHHVAAIGTEILSSSCLAGLVETHNRFLAGWSTKVQLTGTNSAERRDGRLHPVVGADGKAVSAFPVQSAILILSFAEAADGEQDPKSAPTTRHGELRAIIEETAAANAKHFAAELGKVLAGAKA
jgi:hypothetical protein